MPAFFSSSLFDLFGLLERLREGEGERLPLRGRRRGEREGEGEGELERLRLLRLELLPLSLSLLESLELSCRFRLTRWSFASLPGELRIARAGRGCGVVSFASATAGASVLSCATAVPFSFSFPSSLFFRAGGCVRAASSASRLLLSSAGSSSETAPQSARTSQRQVVGWHRHSCCGSDCDLEGPL